jgi:hypothetical protein
MAAATVSANLLRPPQMCAYQHPAQRVEPGELIRNGHGDTLRPGAFPT